MWGIIAQRLGLATTKQVEGLLASMRALRRLNDERWQLLQERYDAVIELIAQIPGCVCRDAMRAFSEENKVKPKPRKKAK